MPVKLYPLSDTDGIDTHSELSGLIIKETSNGFEGIGAYHYKASRKCSCFRGLSLSDNTAWFYRIVESLVYRASLSPFRSLELNVDVELLWKKHTITLS